MSTGSSIRLLPITATGPLSGRLQAVAADTGLRFGRHSHDQFGIGLIRRGGQSSASGRGPVEAGAGDLITVNPGEIHDGFPLGDAGRAWQMLYLDPEAVQDLLADSPGSGHRQEFADPVLRDPGQASRFLSCFTALTRPGDPGGSDLAGLAAEERLIPLLTALLCAPPTPGPAGVPAGIIRARSRIDEDPATRLTLEDLATEAGLSRFHLIRSFRRLTGLTPHAYVVQRRIQHARRLILQGTPLADTAAACGFADQSHMTRQFIRACGIPPGAFARLRRPSAPPEPRRRQSATAG